MEDTIAAISTPAGYGGICILRLSGINAFEIAEKIFLRPNGKHFSDMPAGSIRYGHICSQKGDALDEVLVSKMKAPYTYTAEDVVEINCHGGYAACESVLAEVLKHGARLAQPGEFTRRAFLNGRIDLSQAEAVSDMIESKTSLSAKLAVSQIDGVLSEKINEIKQTLLSTLASLEVSIQYPEYDVDELTQNELSEKVKHALKLTQALTDTYRKGEIMRSGFRVAIIGKPNVGKSMLLNCLTETDKAIVTDIPGTTRDVVDETVNLFGIPVRLMDTAGIRESKNEVEAIGIQRSLLTIEQSQLILFVVDISSPLTDEDISLYEKVKNLDHITVLNKADRKPNKESLSYFEGDISKTEVSAKDNMNIKELEKLIFSHAVTEASDEMQASVAVNSRHNDLLKQAHASLCDALKALENGRTQDLAETDIRSAWHSLGKITGETADEDIIDEIFAHFCLGK